MAHWIRTGDYTTALISSDDHVGLSRIQVVQILNRQAFILHGGPSKELVYCLRGAGFIAAA